MKTDTSLPANPVRILIVGAGAVGQVYGLAAQKTGAEVSVFVRPQYADEAKAGYVLFPLNGSRTPTRLTPKQVFTHWPTVALQTFDQVYVCTSSPALRKGDWVAEMARAIGNATVLLLQPGLEDKNYVSKWIAEKNLVTGLITVISYHHPLPKESGSPGTAFWYPPLTPALFSDGKNRDGHEKSPAQNVAELLRAGGMQTKVVADTAQEVLFAAPTLNIAIAALEVAGWSFSQLKKSTSVRPMTQAIAEAAAGLSLAKGQSIPPTVRLFFRPAFWRFLLFLAPRVVPFSLEIYLRAHFTKVGDQTLELDQDYFELTQKSGVAAPALGNLLRQLRTLRGEA